MAAVSVSIDITEAATDESQETGVFMVTAVEDNGSATAVTAVLNWTELTELQKDIQAALDTYEVRQQA